MQYQAVDQQGVAHKDYLVMGTLFGRIINKVERNRQWLVLKVLGVAQLILISMGDLTVSLE